MELEVIAFDLVSCLTAEERGADRIELCANPHEGGTTASYGMVALARKSAAIALFPIIRPRGGDFLYTDREFGAMVEDIEQCRTLGCDGVVIGMLTADGGVDVDRCARLIETAGPMQVTFHRAFDRTRDPFESLERIIELGCSRILTSGQRPNVDEGRDMLRTLVGAAGNRITIMPGSGVRSSNVLELARFTGATAFHSSARATRPSAMRYTNQAMAEELDSVSIDGDEVAELRRILDTNQLGVRPFTDVSHATDR
jgi:copper homeostasis protein